MKCISLLLSVLIATAGCKITEQKFIGTYKYEHQNKTQLVINTDHTFKFIKINRNPYLYDGDRPAERFYITEGNWKVSKKKLVLTSFTDSVVYKTVDLKIEATDDSTISLFRFYDLYGDSIGTGSYVLSKMETVIAGGNRRIYNIEEDLRVYPNLKFNFYGYGPWEYAATDGLNHNFKVYFIPPFRPSFFVNSVFLLKGKKLVEKNIDKNDIFLKDTE